MTKTQQALPRLWIVDIDGTLALNTGRSPFDWSRVLDDLPNRPVIRVVQALGAGSDDHIKFLTGRMEQCREDTIMWLIGHVFPGIVGNDLFMRADDDYRPDEVVKRELYEQHIRGHYDVQAVIDDRAKVVRMWRNELGLTVLQCAEGDF